MNDKYRLKKYANSFLKILLYLACLSLLVRYISGASLYDFTRTLAIILLLIAFFTKLDFSHFFAPKEKDNILKVERTLYSLIFERKITFFVVFTHTAVALITWNILSAARATIAILFSRSEDYGQPYRLGARARIP